MKTNIIVNLKVPGIHMWPGVAKFEKELPTVQYLAFPHRHMFHIKCVKEVKHSDRDIEIISFKQRVIEYLYTRYYTESSQCLFLGETSCEMLANELAKYFGLSQCEVLEDGENGANVLYEPKDTEIVENTEMQVIHKDESKGKPSRSDLEFKEIIDGITKIFNKHGYTGISHT